MSKNPWFFFADCASQHERLLFCFPSAGSGGSPFVSWSHRLQGCGVLPIQFPGREHRYSERLHQSMDTLVESLGQAMLPYTRQPFAFFGHSFGALVAFETARWLRRQNAPTPFLLHVSSFVAPQQHRIRFQVKNAHNDVLLREVAANFGGLPARILHNQEWLDLYLPPLRADFTILEDYQYRPEPPLECSLVASYGTDEITLGESDLRHWQSQSTGEFLLQPYPGGHFYLEPQREHLLRNLAAELGTNLKTTNQ